MTAPRTIEGERIQGVRAAIARRMMDSLRDAAQLTYFDDADVTRALTQREGWKAAGQRIGIEDMVIAAIALAVRKFPDFNATVEDDMFRVLPNVDVSVAISTPAGLMTPVVRDVQAASLVEIAERRRDLVTRAMEGRLKVSEMKGGSFTISNLGLTRVRHFTPILNRPQVALLGIGRITDMVGLDAGGTLSNRKLMGLSLTADHRVIDGEPSGRFLACLCEELENFRSEP